MSFERGASIGLFVFSAVTLYVAVNISRTSIWQTVGPEVLPTGLALCTMLASVVLFIQTLRPGGTWRAHSKLPAGVKREDRRTQLLVLLGIVVYVAIFEPLGYIVSTALLCIYQTAVFEAGHWVRNVLSGVGYSVAIYAIFVNFLQVLLPKGILGW